MLKVHSKSAHSKVCDGLFWKDTLRLKLKKKKKTFSVLLEAQHISIYLKCIGKSSSNLGELVFQGFACFGHCTNVTAYFACDCLCCVGVVTLSLLRQLQAGRQAMMRSFGREA